MRFFILASWLTMTLVLSGCSLYESDGHKFLASKAYTYSGASARAACSTGDKSDLGDQWVTFSESSEAKAYRNNDSFELRVIPEGQSGSQEFSCLYTFASAQELFQLSNDAVTYTLVKYKDGE